MRLDWLLCLTRLPLSLGFSRMIKKLSFVYELRHHPRVVTAGGHGFTSYVLRTLCGVRSGVGLINKITGDSVIWRIVWVG